jgi:hypothetical protein
VETIRRVERANVKYPTEPLTMENLSKRRDVRTRRIDVMRANPHYDPDFMKVTLPLDDHPLLHIGSAGYSMYDRV